MLTQPLPPSDKTTAMAPSKAVHHRAVPLLPYGLLFAEWKNTNDQVSTPHLVNFVVGRAAMHTPTDTTEDDSALSALASSIKLQLPASFARMTEMVLT